MEAKQNYLARFMQSTDTQFIIPIFQRNYDWKIEHCTQLLFDIINVGSNLNILSHFIGSIVYMSTGVMAPKLIIIDGQQRLTTVTLIWIV